MSDCPHYDLGPPDPEGIQVCRDCGVPVKLRITGMGVEEFEEQRSTFVTGEGEDVPYSPPGEG